ncbi:hypothetical protein HT746_13600 [Burkholderia pyrrocinia]|nr:hypothetical protein [Burkholderia pyrrocinia]
MSPIDSVDSIERDVAAVSSNPGVAPLTRLPRRLCDGHPAHHGGGDPATRDHQVEIHPAFEIRAVFETAAVMAPDPYAAADELLNVHVDVEDRKGGGNDGDPQAYARFHCR